MTKLERQAFLEAIEEINSLTADGSNLWLESSGDTNFVNFESLLYYDYADNTIVVTEKEEAKSVIITELHKLIHHIQSIIDANE